MPKKWINFADNIKKRWGRRMKEGEVMKDE
jgi:hypothetical protein